MQKTEKKMKLCICLIVLNLCFIWGNSLMPGEISAAISHWVQEILESILPSSAVPPPSGHGLLRKLAHFTEFAFLGLWLSWLFAMLRKKFRLPLLCGFLAACTDEFIQCFVPDRGPGFTDVLIDTGGVLLGAGLLWAVFHIYENRK